MRFVLVIGRKCNGSRRIVLKSFDYPNQLDLAFSENKFQLQIALFFTAEYALLENTF